MSDKKICLSLEEKEEWERIFKEYALLKEDLKSREASTAVVGSIFASASFLILVYTITRGIKDIATTGILAFISMILYLCWVIFYCTSQKLDKKYFTKMEKSLESKLCFKIRQEIYKEVKKTWWYRFRRRFWLIILLLLLAFWLNWIAFPFFSLTLNVIIAGVLLLGIILTIFN